MNRYGLDYCIGALEAYLAVWSDLRAMLSDKQENWRETIAEYLRFTNDKVNEWMGEATTILKEDPHHDQ